jgi:helix-turn-helix, Psq domain
MLGNPSQYQTRRDVVFRIQREVRPVRLLSVADRNPIYHSLAFLSKRNLLYGSKEILMNTKSAAQADRISLAVLQQGSFSKAAAVYGVSTTTIWRYSQKPEFQEHCRKARYEKYSLAMSVLQWAANTAMSTLIRLTNHKNVGIRVRAAETILDLARTGVQGDLQAAFPELERTKCRRSVNGNEGATNS